MRRNSFVQAALTGRIGVRLSGGGAASSLDADAATLIAAMTTEPDATRQGHINTLITGLKADGVWDELDELWVTAAHTEQAALLGWKRAHDLTAVNAPTFTVDRGFAGNGTTSYLNTNFVPSTDGVQYTLNDASFGVYSRTNVSSNAIDLGAFDGTRISNISSRFPTDRITARTNQATSNFIDVTSQSDSRGMFVMRRTGASAQNALKNGVSVGSNTNVSTGLPTVAFFVCAANSSGSAVDLSTRQYAAAFVGASMSEAQQLALFTRLETYLDAIGAGVVA